MTFYDLEQMHINLYLMGFKDFKYFGVSFENDPRWMHDLFDTRVFLWLHEDRLEKRRYVKWERY